MRNALKSLEESYEQINMVAGSMEILHAELRRWDDEDIEHYAKCLLHMIEDLYEALDPIKAELSPEAVDIINLTMGDEE